MNIIRSYNPQHLVGKPLVDFIRVEKRSLDSRKILRKWENWFLLKDVPWFVTEDSNQWSLSLWKEDVTGEYNDVKGKLEWFT